MRLIVMELGRFNLNPLESVYRCLILRPIMNYRETHCTGVHDLGEAHKRRRYDQYKRVHQTLAIARACNWCAMAAMQAPKLFLKNKDAETNCGVPG